MLKVRVTFVAPEGEVCEREHYWMVIVFFVVVHHMASYVSAAMNLFAIRLETNPVFTLVIALACFATVIHVLAFKILFKLDVLRSAVGAILLR